jgi:hypothetical protein
MQNVVMNLEQPALIGLEVESPIGTKPAPCKTSQSKQQGYAVLVEHCPLIQCESNIWRTALCW